MIYFFVTKIEGENIIRRKKDIYRKYDKLKKAKNK